MCPDATFIEKGCFGFNLVLFEEYEHHLTNARLLAKKGGTYMAYDSTTKPYLNEKGLIDPRPEDPNIKIKSLKI